LRKQLGTVVMNAISRPQTYATAPYCVEERVHGEIGVGLRRAIIERRAGEGDGAETEDRRGLYANAVRALPERIDEVAPLPVRVPAECPVTLEDLLASPPEAA
jgi:hypothetical protein